VPQAGLHLQGGRNPEEEREYLSDSETKTLLDELNKFFETKIEIKRIRNGEHQTLETLINEEALLFAKYLRGEVKGWEPRVSNK
jgi:CRISPR/Cas system-associated endonuclease Cas1